MTNPTKSDIDRIKQRAGATKIVVSNIRTILAQYHQGRAASSCMDEIDKVMRAVK